MQDIMKSYRDMYANLEDEIESGIEKYRKGDFSVIVKDINGTPLKNTEVKITQKTHQFDFGCNGVMLGQLGENNAKYEKMLSDIFNMITTTFCWDSMETKEGCFRFSEGSEEISRRPPADRVLHFAKNNNMLAKGQPLLADSWYPDWASRDTELLKQQYITFFSKVAEKYDDSYYMFDVVNESLNCSKRTPDFPLLKMGRFDYVKWAFIQAAKVFSTDCLLEWNEATWVNNIFSDQGKTFYSNIAQMLHEGIRLNAVGMQFHFFNQKSVLSHINGNAYSLEDLYKSYNSYSKLNIPLNISEITIPSKFNGMSQIDGEKIQAEILDKLYHLWFSIPNMSGITYWNLMDGTAWQGEGSCLGCIVDSQLREKPAYQQLYQLINRKWKTNLSAVTDENGIVSFRGFYGDYEISSASSTQKASLLK